MHFNLTWYVLAVPVQQSSHRKWETQHKEPVSSAMVLLWKQSEMLMSRVTDELISILLLLLLSTHRLGKDKTFM